MIHEFTARYLLQPSALPQPESLPDGFDIWEWSKNEYTYEPDGWNGIKDVTADVTETLTTGRGDCDDYARVAVSDAVRRGETERGVVGLWTKSFPPKGHLIAYDTHHVYSSGSITYEAVDEYIDRTEYDIAWTRSL